MAEHSWGRRRRRGDDDLPRRGVRSRRGSDAGEPPTALRARQRQRRRHCRARPDPRWSPSLQRGGPSASHRQPPTLPPRRATAAATASGRRRPAIQRVPGADDDGEPDWDGAPQRLLCRRRRRCRRLAAARGGGRAREPRADRAGRTRTRGSSSQPVHSAYVRSTRWAGRGASPARPHARRCSVAAATELRRSARATCVHDGKEPSAWTTACIGDEVDDRRGGEGRGRRAASVGSRPPPPPRRRPPLSKPRGRAPARRRRGWRTRRRARWSILGLCLYACAVWSGTACTGACRAARGAARGERVRAAQFARDGS